MEIEGERSREVATSLHNLGTIASDMTDYPHALELLNQSRVMREQLFGPDDPSVADSLAFMALIHRSRGRSEQARVMHEKVYAIRSQWGDNDFRVRPILTELAELCTELGDEAAAERWRAKIPGDG